MTLASTVLHALLMAQLAQGSQADSLAFHDADARALYDRARQARIAQDSAIRSYEAMAHARYTMYMAVGRTGRRRLFARQESSARIQWERGSGARVHVTGGRAATPAVSGKVGDGLDPLQVMVATSSMTPVPYFPGHEPMFIGARAMRDSIRRGEVIHPLANGAQEHYRYRAGDSVDLRLPDGRVVALRELQVRPRKPWWKLATGSMWLDGATGQVVRAAFRMSEPAPLRYDLSRQDEEPVVGEPLDTLAQPRRLGIGPRLFQGFLNSVASGDASVTGVVLEYGLHDRRFWLPRFQTAEVALEARTGSIIIEQQQSFAYHSVNVPLGLPAIVVDTGFRERPTKPPMPPGLDEQRRRHWTDSVQAAYAHAWKLRDDSTDAGMRVGSLRQCDSSSVRVITEYRGNKSLPVELRIPCDDHALIGSPDLPASIFDAGEELFGTVSAEQLARDALGMSGQGRLVRTLSALSAPRLEFGLSTMRYNRIEGFSPGIALEQQLGGGYRLDASARMGTADRVLNAELGLARTNLRRTLHLKAYKRLASVSDWGTPFDFGSSVTAALLADDEGFYVRSRGAELRWSGGGGRQGEWRLFAERHGGAQQRLTRAIRGRFRPNLLVTEGDFVGFSARTLHSAGEDPYGWRGLLEGRVEGAVGTADYGRGALDFTLSRALAVSVEGALTIGGGASVGELPPQRHWFLGGAQTIRGQRADTSYHGNAFWLSRLELARRIPGVRLIVFGDLGWAGSRARWQEPGRPWSGAGIGASLFEGLARVDLARGLHPERRVRVHTYINARF